MSSILLVSSGELRDMVEELLVADQYEVDSISAGQEALASVEKKKYQVILIEQNLSDMDGLALCSELKNLSAAYLVLLADSDSSLDKIVALEAGVDEYIVTPFDPLEFLLRIGKVAKKSLQPSYTWLHVGDIEVLPSARQAKVGGEQVALTKIEFDLLAYLLQHVGESATRHDLAVACWGSADWLGNGHALNVHMVNMRRKISASQLVKITAVRGIGYRLDALETATQDS